MPVQKMYPALLALLVAAMAMVPCVSAADYADTENQVPIIIQFTISNNPQNTSDLNRTTGQTIQPLNPVPVSNLKKIKVPNPNESAEKQNEAFSDRDWAFLRKSMTDLTEEEQDLLIAEMKKIWNNTSTLSPGEQKNVSWRIGYYLINATEGGKPANPSDLPVLPKERPAQPAAEVPPAIPLIAIGGFGIIRLLMSKKRYI